MDENGKMQPACWPCIDKDRVAVKFRPRKPVGTTFTEDTDTDVHIKAREKKEKHAPGLAPSEVRPKVN
jgi:hypothetical protein